MRRRELELPQNRGSEGAGVSEPGFTDVSSRNDLARFIMMTFSEGGGC